MNFLKNTNFELQTTKQNGNGKIIFCSILELSVSPKECQHVISDQRVYKSYTLLVPPTESQSQNSK